MSKPPVGTAADDPIAALRAPGWDLHVGFGLANPAARLMLTALRTPDGQAIAAAGAPKVSCAPASTASPKPAACASPSRAPSISSGPPQAPVPSSPSSTGRTRPRRSPSRHCLGIRLRRHPHRPGYRRHPWPGRRGRSPCAPPSPTSPPSTTPGRTRPSRRLARRIAGSFTGRVGAAEASLTEQADRVRIART